MENTNGNYDKVQNKTRTNFWWSIGILAFLVIASVCVIILRVDLCELRIMRYLSFLATIMSIVLSVFSIAFSYYSMTSSSEQWGHARNAITEIETLSNVMTKNNTQLFQNVVDITTNLGKLEVQMAQFLPKDAGDATEKVKKATSPISDPVISNDSK